MTKTTEAPKKPGRQRIYDTEADRQRAYRERRSAKLKERRKLIRWCKQFCSMILEAPDPARLRALATQVAKQLEAEK